MININISNNTNKRYVQINSIIKAVKSALKGEKVKIAEVSIVLLNNDDILDMNIKYLEHDYPTDVISFTIEQKPLLCDIYIGLEIAEEQSKEYNVSLTNELKRLAVHGVLHCIGYDDDTVDAKNRMKALEDKYINV